MNKLKRFYDKNRKVIWLFIIIVASLIILLKLLNSWAALKGKEKIEKLKEEENSNISLGNSITTNNNSNTTILGESTSLEEMQKDTQIIDKFIKYCSNGNVDEAYSLLTEECKEEMYSSKESFKQNYVDKLFTDSSIDYEANVWIDNTYKVDFIIGNILATGKEEDAKTMQDYITVKSTKEGKKLNINKYIGRKEINKEKEKNNLNIVVLYSDIYLDYVSYEIKVENKSNSDILLDTRKDMNTMYLLDEKDVKYAAYTHELTEADLTITRNSTRTIRIKYYSSYTSNKNIVSLVFSNIITDYDSTTKMINSQTTEEIGVYL